MVFRNPAAIASIKTFTAKANTSFFLNMEPELPAFSVTLGQHLVQTNNGQLCAVHKGDLRKDFTWRSATGHIRL